LNHQGWDLDDRKVKLLKYMQVKVEKGESYEEALEAFNDIHQRDKIFSEMKKEILERNKENKDFLKLKTN
jgi:predicted DNA-binding protein YlxM (UPF0122 family)